MPDLRLPDFVGNIQKAKSQALGNQLLGLQVRSYPADKKLEQRQKEAYIKGMDLRNRMTLKDLQTYDKEYQRKERMDKLRHALDLYKFGQSRLASVQTPTEWNKFREYMINTHGMESSFLPALNDAPPDQGGITPQAFAQFKEDMGTYSRRDEILLQDRLARERGDIEYGREIELRDTQHERDLALAKIRYPTIDGLPMKGATPRAMQYLAGIRHYLANNDLEGAQYLLHHLDGEMTELEGKQFDLDAKLTVNEEEHLQNLKEIEAEARFKILSQKIIDDNQMSNQMKRDTLNANFEFYLNKNKAFFDRMNKLYLMQKEVELGKGTRIGSIIAYRDYLNENDPEHPMLQYVEEAVKNQAKGLGARPLSDKDVLDTYQKYSLMWMARNDFIDHRTGEMLPMDVENERKMHMWVSNEVNKALNVVGGPGFEFQNRARQQDAAAEPGPHDDIINRRINGNVTNEEMDRYLAPLSSNDKDAFFARYDQILENRGQ